MFYSGTVRQGYIRESEKVNENKREAKRKEKKEGERERERDWVFILQSNMIFGHISF